MAALRTLASAVVVAMSCASAQAGSSAPSGATGPFRFSIQGGFVAGSPSFAGARTFTEFAEQGRIESQYKEDPGPGLEAGLAWKFARRLGVSAAVSFDQRKEAGSFSATLPHPLYFGVPRRTAGDFRGGTQRETAVHLDLAFLGGSGRLQWSAFAGPSLIGVAVDLVQRVEYTQTYPFDTVMVTGTPLARTSGNAVGFNLGAGLDWQLARHAAIGTQVRFSRATVSLKPSADDRVDVDGGGAHVTAGLRLDF
jgi:opacity protein-like surface antigen